MGGATATWTEETQHMKSLGIKKYRGSSTRLEWKLSEAQSEIQFERMYYLGVPFKSVPGSKDVVTSY